MNGIILIDKPPGVTSADIVRTVKRRVRVKVGHLGTLDPFASGLLPLCLGEATKIAQFLNTAGKIYEGTIQLGQATDTGDCTGTVTATAALPSVEEAEIHAVSTRFRGAQKQVPPMYSALKRDGVPLYKLARQGIEVERESRSIRIDSLDMEPLAEGLIRFSVACSKGTYVRVLAEDIGRALGTVAHLKTLRRTGFGSFAVSHAIRIDEWEPDGRGLLSIRAALAHLPVLNIDAAGATAVRRGQGWWLDKAMAGIDRERVVLIEANNEVVAVVEQRGSRWCFARVLSPPESLHGGDPMVGTHSKQTGKTEDGWD